MPQFRSRGDPVIKGYLKGPIMTASPIRRARGLSLVILLGAAALCALLISWIGVGATLTVAGLAATAAMFVVLIDLTGFGT